MARITQYRTQVDVQAWTPEGVHYHQALMGDLKTITTSKTTTQPYGTFTLTFTMREDAGGSWADKLPYRTYVEIRAGVGSGTPPILMRGFVDAPGQSMSMPGYPAGPQREVTISGRDMGAILNDWQVLYLWGLDPESTYFAANLPSGGNALAVQLGVSAREDSPTRLLTAFITELVNDGAHGKGAVVGIRQQIPQVPYFVPQIRIPDQYRVNFLSLQPWQGSYSNFLDYFASPPWGEDFVFDAPEGPQIIVRQTPYKAYDTGQYPLPFGGTPMENGFFADVTMAAGDITAHDLILNGGLQDYVYFSVTPDLASSLAQSYAMFFYVYQGQTPQRLSASQAHALQKQGRTVYSAPAGTTSAGVLEQVSPAQAQRAGSNPYFDAQHAKLWGIQDLQLTTPWVSTLKQTFDTNAQEIVAKMCTWLASVYQGNPRFASGTLTVHGHEQYTVGRYVVVEPGAITSDPQPWEAYIQSIDSQIDIASNNATWTMDLGVIRGRVRTG